MVRDSEFRYIRKIGFFGNLRNAVVSLTWKIFGLARRSESKPKLNHFGLSHRFGIRDS